MNAKSLLIAMVLSSVVCAADPADSPSAAPVAARPVRILAIGNSFSLSLCRFFPTAAAAEGFPVEFCNLYIGGCPLDRHVENIRKAAEDPEFDPYEVRWFHADRPASPIKFKSNIPQMLATQAWDFVTIQQASPKSWKPETYRPAADELIAEIHRLAPQAEIIVHQTWAYNARDARLNPGEKSWGFDQAGMSARVEDAYSKLADAFGFRTIPCGAAVRLRRSALAEAGRAFDPASLDLLAPGEKPDLRGDPVGSFRWENNDAAARAEGSTPTLGADTIHLNALGQYLQAVTWLAFFSGRDPRTFSFAPVDVREGSPEEFAGLRAAAALALEEQRGKERK